jgi:hypothetical protein
MQAIAVDEVYAAVAEVLSAPSSGESENNVQRLRT